MEVESTHALKMSGQWEFANGVANQQAEYVSELLERHLGNMHGYSFLSHEPHVMYSVNITNHCSSVYVG